MILTAIAIVAVRAGNNPINSVDMHAEHVCDAALIASLHSFSRTACRTDAMKVPLPCQAEETKSTAMHAVIS